MRASLRWTSALLAAAVLGFATGRFLVRDAQEGSDVLAPRNAGTAGPASRFPPATALTGLPVVPATLAGILRLRGDFAQTTALYVLASRQDRNGIERLLNEAASIRQPSERRAASSILYERYAELDPRAAVGHIMNRGADFDPGWLHGVFHSWARSDLESALAHVGTLDNRSRVIGGSAILRARDDLPPREREALAAKLELRILQQDPAAIDLRTPQAAERSWRSALATKDHDARSMKMHTLVQSWARQDPRAALRAIDALRDRSEREHLLQQGLQAWTEKEPRQAVDWALARPPSQERTQLLASTLSSLVTREPSLAMELSEALSSAEREQILPQVLSNWANVDAASAAARAESLQSPRLRGEALTSVAMVYATRLPDEAISWAASLPDQESQVVMAMVISQIAATEPARASVLVNHLNSGSERENAIMNIAHNWTQWDPQAALAWVGKLYPSDVSASVYTSLFAQWAVRDVDAAIGHTSQLHDAASRNAALTGILGSPYLESGLVERLYQRVEGDEARRHAAAQLYYRLSEIDPESAERYRIEAGMDEQAGEAEIVR